MHEENRKNQSESRPQTFWPASDIANLTKVLAVICEGQKAYGKQTDLGSVLAYFKLKFEHRYTVPQVIFALEKYTDLKNDIPTPADILAILNPPKPRITEAAYVAAQKWQERNGYPIFSDAKTIIEEYEQQERDASRDHTRNVEALQAIGGNPFKRLT